MSKKNIVVCCETMADALRQGLHYYPSPYLNQDGYERKPEGVQLVDWHSELPAFNLCPWCGKALPFPYEKEE